jgi:hypothetical protein
MRYASIRARLDRVGDRLRPASCWSRGPRCWQTVLVGDGSDDPPVPELPAVCPDCSRPMRWQFVILAGTDVARL